MNRISKLTIVDLASPHLTHTLAMPGSTVAPSRTDGLTLANVDWLHAGAEQLLTFTNVAEVVGLKLTLESFNAAGVNSEQGSSSILRSPALIGIVAVAAVTLAITWGTATSGLNEHTPFLGGVGGLPDGVWTLGFTEPANALSLPTWAIHISSLLEWLVAMGLVWRIGIASGNPKWKGLTWAMIPSHSSGVCACVCASPSREPALQ